MVASFLATAHSILTCEALANAAQRYGLTINLPSVATLQDNQIDIDTAEITPVDRLMGIAESSDSELPLLGDLRWSDAADGSQTGGSR